MKTQYSALFKHYDVMCGRSPESWANYLDSLLSENGVKKGELVLDAACGTADVTSALSKKGYDMTGFDISPEMLSIAYTNTQGQNVLLLCQSLTEFELYGTVKAILCNLDGLNYLKDETELSKFFSLCHNYLDDDGVLIFDINTPYKFEYVYSDRDYIIENDDGSCLLCWSCDYDTDAKKCRFALSFFEKNEDGSWWREDEEQFEYCHSPDMIEKLLINNGFKISAKHGELSLNSPKENEERIHFICKKD